MRFLLSLFLSSIPASLAAQGLEVDPTFRTQFRYEQYAQDRLLGSNDAMLFRARPGVSLVDGDWSLIAESDAAIAVRRAGTSEDFGRMTPPESVQLNQLRLRYTGLPATTISVGRQQLGLAGSITGDRDGEQTFDAARLQWRGNGLLGGLRADVAYAWASRSLWAGTDEALLPETVTGDNIFARLDWSGRLGTLSGYAYQVDQRPIAGHGDFRLSNQVLGARFSGQRRLTENVNLNYALGYNRQSGALTSALSATPTYWTIGSNFDFGYLASTQTSYRRFLANGLALSNGDELSLATSATTGRLTIGARWRPPTASRCRPAWSAATRR
jgi:hypothetical protein